MKKPFSILLMTFLFSTTISAQNNYNALWDKVKKHELENLPKSALKVVDKIYTKAVKHNNSPQIIKTLFYKSKFSLILEENAQLKIINQFKTHIDKSVFPTKNMLENVLANLYWQYFNQHRWQFYNRTKTAKKVNADDFRTWDLNTLFTEIHLHYQASLQNGLLLQQTNITSFKDILHLPKESKKYRPTLYDFLAHNALTFYKTSETNITKPSYQFKIDNPKLLDLAEAFAIQNIQSKDSLSLQLHALKIYQELTLFHLKDKNFTALADVDLERLQFVKQHATFTNKKNIILQTLNNATHKYKENEIEGLYTYEIAKIYHQDAQTYQPTKNEVYRFENKRALELCESVIKKYPKSEGAKKCKNLKQQILSKSLQLVVEKNCPIAQYTRANITYKNINQLYFSMYKVTQNQLSKYNRFFKNSEKISFVKKLTKIHSWKATLKNESDYQQHRTETVIPKLTKGMYLILASDNQKLNDKSIFGTSSIQATNLVLIGSNQNNSNIFQVVDRNTGTPLKEAKVTLTNKPYNRYNKKLFKHFTTNTNGEFEFNPSENNYGNVKALISYKNDDTIIDNIFINSFRKRHVETPKVTPKTFLFTDRSIYRPSQTVYFKGILMETFQKKSKVITNEQVFVTLFDINHQKVKELTVTSNEFGSFSGEFILPNTGLTGRFSITISGSDFHRNTTSFSVEEYKRPKFETEFKPITKSYKINDSVTVHGFAKAFSGANITDAKVTYRVHRKVQYPHWWYWYRPQFSSTSQEITHGETTTDESGNYKITFKALADESVNKDNLPIFNYEITADITDINGETHSTTSIVKVGYHSLIAKVSIADALDKNNKKQKISIDTKNLNGEFVAASGTIKIYKLTSPKHPLRNRPWASPDYQVIPKDEFEQKFPHDAYKNEDNYRFWAKGELVFDTDFDTNTSKEIALKRIKKWRSGKYIIELESTDKFGQKVSDKQFFTVFSNKDKLPADNQLFSLKTDKTDYKIGENVLLTLNSNSADVTVKVTVEKQHKIVTTHLIHLNKNSKQLRIPVHKEDLGGFAINYHFVNYNDFINGHQQISVPYPKTDLEITTNTFRDKLQPGSNQTWSFTIKGTKKDKAVAEVLASMYDASLEQFTRHQWQFNPIYNPIYHSYSYANAYSSFGNHHFRITNIKRFYASNFNHEYPQLNWFGFGFSNHLRIRGANNISYDLQGKVAGLKMKGRPSAPQPEAITISEEEEEEEESLDEVVIASTEFDNDGNNDSKNKEKPKPQGVQIRKNFNETAFFYPHLTTNKEGEVSFNFTIPEALSKWKLQLLAHTKQLHSATKTLTTVTQKELMIVPNTPRFLREGDELILSAKISNLTDKKLKGIAELSFTNPLTGKDISLNILKNRSVHPKIENKIGLIKIRGFSVDKNGNTTVSWKLNIPKSFHAIQYKITAKAGDFSDGEQNVLPVLSNRMLVTETLPMWIRGNETKTFTLKKLVDFDSAQSPSLKHQTSTLSADRQDTLSHQTTTLSHHKLTLEMTSNPVWYAVQALPYLMEYPHECSEQTFARYYANTLASFVANSNPKIQEVFNAWKNSDALLSNLEKNQELKSLIIQETPWVRDAQSESEQKKRIALLFDLNKMKNEQQRAVNKLQNMQMSNGGFPWFKGSRYANPYITQHIASGFGHLKKLGIPVFDTKTQQIIGKAVQFLDAEIIERYQEILKNMQRIKKDAKTLSEGKKAAKKYLASNHLGYFELHYLYMRSFYPDISISNATQKAVDYFKKQSATYWTDFNLYAQGQIALIQFRTGDKKIASKIVKSLKENSITSDELGMYWKNNTAGYFYYQAPVETQALLIEVFSEIENDTKTIDNLKIWLLKNKQTNRWKTTKATTEAVYALLLQGSNQIESTNLVGIKIGDKNIHPNTIDAVKIEAGTGYFKTSWSGAAIQPNMGKITLTKKDKGIAWGALYWQYFEDLDKITTAETPLKLRKKLFLKTNSDTGKVLTEITDTSTSNSTPLKVGDLITVRIELRSDRDMEFIHLKDMRASGVEPINVLSRYKWQDGLGYYESTKDAATHFFFDRLPKGVYVFEYDVRVNNVGNFSNGISTIQSMYAPEFNSHSEGVRIKVSQ